MSCRAAERGEEGGKRLVSTGRKCAWKPPGNGWRCQGRAGRWNETYLPQVGLVLKATLAVEDQVGEESLDRLAKTLVEAIVGVGGEEVLNLVEEAVLVGSVLAVLRVPEALALLLELTAATVGLVLHDVSGLLEAGADVGVELAEPSPVRAREEGRGVSVNV
jgi:hypothetical protein